MSITQARLRELLQYDPDTGVFTNIVSRCSRAQAGQPTSLSRSVQGYLRACLDRKSYLAHRLAWLYCNGEFPTLMLDHIDGDKANNRLANLRMATKEMNQQNRRRANKRSRTGLLGVAVADDKFVARIHKNGKTLHLGRFGSAQDAYAAYVKAKRELHEGCTI